MTVKEAILVALRAGDPRLTPNEVLRMDVLAMPVEFMPLAEFEKLLEIMESKKLILGIYDELDCVRKWKLTERGRAILLEKGR